MSTDRKVLKVMRSRLRCAVGGALAEALVAQSKGEQQVAADLRAHAQRLGAEVAALDAMLALQTKPPAVEKPKWGSGLTGGFKQAAKEAAAQEYRPTEADAVLALQQLCRTVHTAEVDAVFANANAALQTDDVQHRDRAADMLFALRLPDAQAKRCVALVVAVLRNHRTT